MRHFFILLAFFPGLLLAQMNGSYTVGGVNPDFATVGEACDSMMSQGINGPVTINIRDGVYTNDSIYLASLMGNSSINTITFQSESLDSSLVELNHDNAIVVHLADSTCGYITIQHLTIDQKGNERNIFLQNGPHHCTLKSLNIFKSNSFTSQHDMVVVRDADSLPPSKKIELVQSNFNVGQSVTGASPIYVYSNLGIDSLRIEKNRLAFPLSCNITYAVEIDNVSNLEFNQNYISGNAGEGIYCRDISGQNTISNNEFYLYAIDAWCVDIEDCTGDFNISNNLIRAGSGYSNYGSLGFNASQMTGPVNFYNNTIYSDGVGLYVGSSDSALVQNNLIYVNFQGVSSSFKGTYRYVNSNVYSDYNALYSNADFAELNNSVIYNDLNSFSAVTGYDQNSFILMDPLFYDDSLNLHVCSDSLIGVGDPSVVLLTDIDGELRGASSIGADYFEPLQAGFSFVQNGYDVQFTNASVWADTYEWDFGDGNLSNDMSPMHTYSSNGTYTVSLTVTNGCGTADTTVQLSFTVGLDDLSTETLGVYPNPSNGTFVVQVDGEIAPMSVKIMSLKGDVVYQNEILSGEQIELDAPNGLYVLEVKTSEQILRGKIIVR